MAVLLPIFAVWVIHLLLPAVFHHLDARPDLDVLCHHHDQPAASSSSSRAVEHSKHRRSTYSAAVRSTMRMQRAEGIQDDTDSAQHNK